MNNKLNIVNVIIVIKLLLLHFIIFNGNYDSLIYCIIKKLNKKNESGIPINKTILNLIKKELNKINNINRYRFIDFGCGEGKVLLNVNYIFDEIHGIEIDNKNATIAENNTKNYENIKVFNQDILDYKFIDTDTIFYLYEPLWNCDKKYAFELYDKVFTKLSKVFKNSDNKVYIVYVSGVSRKDIKDLKKYNFKQIYEKKIGSLLFNRVVKIFSNK